MNDHLLEIFYSWNAKNIEIWGKEFQNKIQKMSKYSFDVNAAKWLPKSLWIEYPKHECHTDSVGREMLQVLRKVL